MDDAMAAAFTSLFVGLFGRLKARGVLDQVDLNEIFESATLGFEEMGLDSSETARTAHGFLRSLQSIVDR
ncbi:hypothetical protein [Phenylobacterium sp.]|uniref:hypothetical protein n=1 Tax=Phenylobacterium sp. TaxID=1871053 RepID=UPI0030F3E8B3